MTLLPAGETAQRAVASALDSSEFGLGGVPSAMLDEVAVILREVGMLVDERIANRD